MAAQLSSDQFAGILRDTIVSLVRRDGVDLSARQLGVFLTCYLNEGGHTVRGLARDLNVSMRPGPSDGAGFRAPQGRPGGPSQRAGAAHGQRGCFSVRNPPYYE